jgi:hypothetical protein
LRIAFDVNKQEESIAAWVHAPVVFFDAASERLKIQRLKRALRLQFPPIVAHKRLAIDDKNIRLDTCESAIERVEKRPLVPIVIVRMCMQKRFGSVSRANTERTYRE